MKVFISAAEASSDTHAAEALKHLKVLCRERGKTLEAFGVGGPKLRSAGLRALLPAEDLLVMGFVEVLTRVPKLRRVLRHLLESIRDEKPDVVVLCDYPEFHFKLASKIRSLGIPIVCFIPPKIWVWRKNRIRKLSRLYDRVLSILPFEENTYLSSNVSFKYVGNPLMDELPIAMTRTQARAKLGLAESDRVLALLVGSRPSEFKFHLEPLLQAARIVSDADPARPLQVLLPIPETADLSRFRERIAATPFSVGLRIQVSQGDSWTVMKAADCGIIKSGTSSLEAALLDCPHVVVYRAHPISEFIFKNIIRYRHAISLTNLIGVDDSEIRVVRELILKEFTPEKIAQEALSLLGTDSQKRVAQMKLAFGRIRERLGSQSPSRQVAEEIYKMATEVRV